MHAFSRWTSLAALLLPFAALAGAPDPTAELADSLARQAHEHARSPRAAAYLVRLHALRDEVEDLNLLGQTYEQLAGQRSTDPLVRDLARMLAVNLERGRGRLGKAVELSTELGYLHDFYVTGGFDNEGKAGCDTDFGPEAASLDLSAAYPAKGHSVTWHKLTAAPHGGFIDLSETVRPDTEAVAYAVAFLQAEQEARVQLGVGTSGAFRLWLNGQRVAASDDYHQARPDQARVEVKLRKGVNRLLLKLCQDREALGFFLRATPASAAAVPLTPLLPDTAPPLVKGPPPSPKPLPTLASALAKEVARRPGDATLRGELASVLDFTRAFDSRAHTDTVQAELAAKAAPADAGLQLLAAGLQEEDSNTRRRYLEAALRVAPTSPHARLALARHELDHEHPERALPLLTALRADYPGFGAAALAQVRAHEALGEKPRAARLIDDALRDFPHLPAVVREAASTARYLDRFQDAVDRLRLVLALRFDDNTSRRSLASLLADLSQVDEASAALEQLLKLEPFDNSSRLRLAELYAANGQPEAASRLFAEARALAPGEPDVHEREGQALLQAGQREQAMAAFERALALRPQNPSLREMLRLLKGEDAAHGAQYTLDVQPLIPEADAFVHEDAVYLVDYTYYRILPSGQASRFQQVVVKVYTQRGVDAFRNYSLTYAPDRQEVRVLRARITKPDGSVVDSYGDADRSVNESWSKMYYDTRAKMLAFPALAPGDVLELHLRRDDTAQENLLSDYWGDVDSVQAIVPKVRNQYLVDMPAGRPLYWNRSSLPPGVAHSEEPLPDGRVLYRWTARSVSKIVPEPSMPGWAEVSATLHVSTYKAWEDVGRYYWGLVRDQLAPNDELQQTVEQVLAGVDRKDERAVVQAIYNFVVTNTRYVALEFGIHSFKPYRVDRILARRFGDCKDKASLIHAMLKVAGVDSRLVLLRTRNLGTLGAEPASLAAFNHAIAYVPSLDLYLDGTAESHGTRELPSSDRRASVLVVEPNGGSRFLTTPEARAEDNPSTVTADVTLALDGSAELKGDMSVTGESAPDYRRSYRAASSRKTAFEQTWGQTFPGLAVSELRVSNLDQLEQAVSVQYRMTAPRYAEVLPGSLRFHPLGSGRAFTQALALLSERRFDLVLPSPWLSRSRFKYTLPPGYTAGELPPPIFEKSPFGYLRLACEQEGSGLLCEGEVALTETRIKAEDYPAFRAFLTRLDQAYSRKITVTGAVPTAQREP